MQVVVYLADWCGPSKMIKGALSRANIKYEAIDIEEDPTKASNNNIKGLPTTLILDNNNKEVERLIGFSEEVITKIKGYVHE
mgnify:CR=1 FL=1